MPPWDKYQTGGDSGGPWAKYSGQPATRSWSDVPLEALSNVPESAINFAKDVAQPFIHPIDTAKSMANLGMGVMEKLGLKGSAGHEKYADAVGQFLKDRYGSAEAIKKTLATDPVGMAADVSMILTGGGSAAARAPGMIGRAGEIAGAAGRAIDPVNTAIRTVKPTLSGMPQTLREAGVLMTPGQMAGGVGKKIEDAASSIPLLGDFINSGRAKSIESFNTAVANQALEPIGKTLRRGTEAGHATINETGRTIGEAYDKLLPQLTLRPDGRLLADFRDVLDRDVAVLPRAQQDQFRAIIDARVGQPRVMDGRELKDIQSELTYLSNQYRHAPDPAQRGLGRALDHTLEAMMQNLERSNPRRAQELRDVNTSYAMFARMRGAATQRATSAGVFTPSDLLQAAKKGDSSNAKGSFARGEALMQAFGEAGQKVLPSSVPDSGTARRLMTAGAGAYAANALGHPAAIPAAGAALAGYTKPGMRATNAYMDPRTRAHRAIRDPRVPVAGQAAFQAGRASDVAEGNRKPLHIVVTRPSPLQAGAGSPLAPGIGP